MTRASLEPPPAPTPDVALLDRPPGGCWLRWEPDAAVAGASERSLVAAGFLLVFSVFWNSVLGSFVGVCASWAARSVGMTLPEGWAEARLAGGGEGLLAVFLLPFIAASFILAVQLCLALAGKTEVGRSGPNAWIRRSVGPVGWTRRFAVADVEDVRWVTKRWRDSDGDARETMVLEVVLRGGGVRGLGAGLTAERRAFLQVAARRVLGV